MSFDADRKWAEAYCAFRRLRYLSHERYGDELRIAVEAPGERYEVSVNVPLKVLRDFTPSEAPAREEKGT